MATRADPQLPGWQIDPCGSTAKPPGRPPRRAGSAQAQLAKCPSVGATYWAWEREPTDELRECPSLPDSDDPGWYVDDRGGGRWRVSFAGSEWQVERITGTAGAAGDVIEVSSFVFAVAAEQAC